MRISKSGKKGAARPAESGAETDSAAAPGGELTADVVIFEESEDEQLRQITGLDKVPVTHVLQKKLKYREEDLGKFIVSILTAGADHPHFCAPGESAWWANGLSARGRLGESFRLFADQEEIKNALVTDNCPPPDATCVNVHALELIDGKISLSVVYQLFPQ